MTSPPFSLPDGLARKGVSVRIAEERDRAFLRALFAQSRSDAPYLAAWPEREREVFLDSQFHAQDTHFRQFYAQADFLVLERDGEPVGRLILDRSAPDWCLVDIALLPAARGQGLGTDLLKAMQVAATAGRAATINLHVEIGNPAHALYARLGFTEVESESGAHIAMVWTV